MSGSNQRDPAARQHEGTGGVKHLLSTTIYLKDMALFDGMNRAWDAWVPEGKAPARACVEARMASPELLVEISVVAALSR